jgi:enoyl-[acyl-carrier protein] reductase I
MPHDERQGQLSMDLTGRRAVVLGVANEDSIAWHVARGLGAAGAAVHLGYQQRFKSRVLQILKTAEFAPAGLWRCDVTQPGEVEALVRSVGAPIDILVHSIAWAPPASFGRPIQDAEAAEFSQTLEVSAYSLLQVTRAALASLAPEASVIAMTYLGAQRVVQGYRLMGIAKAALEAVVRELAVELGPRGVRVNAISAGPIKTLAAQAVPGFDDLLAHYTRVTPLRTLVDGADVANLAVFLGASASRHITGQVLHVDAGFSILGVVG